jgi:hypothetical protein
VAIPHPSNEREELGNTSSSPRASVISIPELFTYALYIVIAFVLEVIYLGITFTYHDNAAYYHKHGNDGNIVICCNEMWL